MLLHIVSKRDYFYVYIFILKVRFSNFPYISQEFRLLSVVSMSCTWEPVPNCLYFFFYLAQKIPNWLPLALSTSLAKDKLMHLLNATSF